MISASILDGRWHTEAEVSGHAKVAVLGRTLAKTTGKGVGDQIRLSTGGGPATLRVIGVSSSQTRNGSVIFMPVATLQAVLGSPGEVNNYWITTTSDDHGLIDRTTTRLEDTLAAHGNQVGSIVNYDAKEKQIAANGMITKSITVLGLLIRRDQHGGARQRDHDDDPRAHA